MRNLSQSPILQIFPWKINFIFAVGDGKARRYVISQGYALLKEIDVQKYFEKEIDDREIVQTFKIDLIANVLANTRIFSTSEVDHLNELNDRFTKNIAELKEFEFKKELERLAIDLSWKSSQIEGNTYSLLETERLLKEKQTAEGKTKDEAVMLLNHKEAIDFIVENPRYLEKLSVPTIEDIHSILIKELGVDRNIRKRKVGITGTNYSPLDNEFQIKEALEQMCVLINSRTLIFEKALLAILLISYIQPFVDGNKRTARIVGNSILIGCQSCPISFRTVDSIDYKKAMLIFYEKNNLSAFKKIFIEQFDFAVKTYF